MKKLLFGLLILTGCASHQPDSGKYVTIIDDNGRAVCELNTQTGDMNFYRSCRQTAQELLNANLALQQKLKDLQNPPAPKLIKK